MKMCILYTEVGGFQKYILTFFNFQILINSRISHKFGVLGFWGFGEIGRAHV